MWSIFETQCFKCFFKKNDIKKYAEKNCNDTLLGFLKEEFKYFYDRYQDKKLYRHLKHEEKFKLIDNLLIKSIGDISNVERFMFLLYVVYRYRNNIFHGNKSLGNWLNYETEMEYCINIMTKITDNHVERNSKIA